MKIIPQSLLSNDFLPSSKPAPARCFIGLFILFTFFTVHGQVPLGKTRETETINISSSVIKFPPSTNAGPKAEAFIPLPEIQYREGERKDINDKMVERIQTALRRLTTQSGRFAVKTSPANAYEIKCTISELLVAEAGQKKRGAVNSFANGVAGLFGKSNAVPQMPDIILVNDKTMVSVACNLSLELYWSGEIVWASDGKIDGNFNAKQLSLQLQTEANGDVTGTTIKTALLQTRVVETALFQAFTSHLADLDTALAQPREKLSQPKSLGAPRSELVLAGNATEPALVAKVHCPHCGLPLGPGRFCGECGGQVSRCEGCRNPVNTCEIHCVFCGKKCGKTFLGPTPRN